VVSVTAELIRELAKVLDMAESDNNPEVARLLRDALKLAAATLAETKFPPALTSDPKIACIKSICERTGLGLKEAKELYERTNNSSFQPLELPHERGAGSELRGTVHGGSMQGEWIQLPRPAATPWPG